MKKQKWHFFLCFFVHIFVRIEKKILNIDEIITFSIIALLWFFDKCSQKLILKPFHTFISPFPIWISFENLVNGCFAILSKVFSTYIACLLRNVRHFSRLGLNHFLPLSRSKSAPRNIRKMIFYTFT